MNSMHMKTGTRTSVENYTEIDNLVFGKNSLSIFVTVNMYPVGNNFEQPIRIIINP